MGKFIKKICLCTGAVAIGLASALTMSATKAYAADYYISTTGNDSNSGKLKAPFASIAKAQAVASSGDTVYIMGGIYKKFNIAKSDNVYNYVIDITKSGITYKAYSMSDMPTFDFSNITTSKRVAAFRIARGVTDVTITGINVTGVPVGTQKQSECFRVEGNVTLNRVTCHDNAANGFYFVNHGTGTCYRCDSYNNIGVKGISMGNTDGFGAHGEGVTFKECRAWNCSDDGYDCLTSTGTNTFDTCWAYNMNAGGDSNGFKIGGYAMGTPPAVAPVHTVKNCLSASNGAHGFYANHQPGKSATWTNNTAYNNKFGNFDMLERVSTSDATDIPGTREVLHNNISFGGVALKDANLPNENVTDNSWNKSGVSVTADDFQSLDASQMTRPRGKDGELPDITFMHLNSNSDLNGLGCF
ncbi:pectate lyase [Clostridium sp. YIM B02555]|uniref:right-handed parallel beta-helix repeat-containing protein n=1 Tax=Clostridium sp. YIM B02555 TaxID=2911968 RepID=UPI001EEDD5A8|nr:pectate lyase [Clostridium sp. YIM B02555]